MRIDDAYRSRTSTDDDGLTINVLNDAGHNFIGRPRSESDCHTKGEWAYST